MKNIIKWFIPPGFWKLPVIILIGIFTGIFAYCFYISRAPSYLSDKPETCVNCHVMAPQYATWQHSSHREIATCNDCHVPHNNVFEHYGFKAKDGMRHATIYTLRTEPQVIHINEAGIKVVQANCTRCHNHLFTSIAMPVNHKTDFTNKLCWDCHREIPHGRVNSLSSVPNARVPVPESPVPEWLKKYIK
jgi:cytochrome c nitrite reductase small subunit